jgi:PAS domain S-box-containing protein
MPSITPGQLAFSAMQFLPVPLLVLSSLKTVVLANEAMGRLLGIIPDETEGGAATTSDHLRGHGLSQVGVDMVQDGRPVWINWERFLDSLVSEKTNLQRGEENQSVSDKDPDAPETANTPGAPEPQTVQGSDHGSKAPAIEHPGNTAVVEVIISRKDIRKSSSNSKVQMKTAASQRRAKMIITIFEVENHQAYFTLTFTNTDSDSQSTLYPISRHSVTRTSLMETAKGASISSSDTSLDSLLDAVSPSAVSMSTNPFPPHGPPVEGPVSGVPSILQKIIVMKDALIDHTETPIVAMWKDGSAMFPNQAARKLFDQQSDLDGSVNGFELLGGWKLWNEDFTAQLELSGFPMSVLLRTETPFTGRRVGIYDSDGNKRVLEAEGELIRDELSGEVLAGVVTFRDVTKIAQMITRIKEEDEERFKTMCDAMPQLVFTTTPEGHLEFYNKRWYEYTGLTVAASVGEGWMRAVHPEDVEESNRLFQHSLRTGEPFMTEYRCQSKEGEWKWFITRALPLRSKENGEILKWYGTCTDANEHILSRHEAKRTRQQLLTVIAHARVTIFQVDIHRRITMLEGALIEDALGAHDWYIGQDVHHVFSQLTSEAEHQQRRKFLEPIDTIIAGHQDITVQVDEIGGDPIYPC